jgi:hypothetical protein
MYMFSLDLDSAAYIKPGLPDGMFLNQKSKCGEILEGLAIECVVQCTVFLIYFMDLW